MKPTRYPASLVLLHWLLAIMLLGMLTSGLLIGSELLPKMQEFLLIQWHKTFGAGVLVLVSLRLAVRGWAMLTGRIPAPQASFKRWEINLAYLGHLGLYTAMVLVPLSGWIMVSSSPYGMPILLWGSVAWPNLPGLTGLGWVNSLAQESHELLTYGLLALLALHIGAVLKHWYLDKTNLFPRIWFGALLGMILILPSAAQATPYQPNLAHSQVLFKGMHANQPFQGRFTQWDAKLDWNSADPTQSTLQATFGTASATTGNATYDATLPTTDWLNVEKFPTATFLSTAVAKGAKNFTYTARGMLTLRGVTQPVVLTFTVVAVPKRTDGTLRAIGGLTVDRLAFGIGQQSDPAATWVSRNITIQFDVVATPTLATSPTN